MKDEKKRLNQDTIKYSKAVESLQKSVSSVRDAKADLDKMSAAIKKVAAAINKVKSIIRMGIHFVAQSNRLTSAFGPSAMNDRND